MQDMRKLLGESLARALRTLPEVDRLQAALPVVCGSSLAAHCAVMDFDGKKTVHLQVSGQDWLKTLMSMQDTLEKDLRRVAGVPLTGICLSVERTGSTGRLPATDRRQVGRSSRRALVQRMSRA